MTTERTYRIGLIVNGKLAYEYTLDQSSAKEALTWGFYWLPSDWIHREPCDCARIHGIVCIPKEDGSHSSWKHYDLPRLEDASAIKNFTQDDLKHLLAGQDLVWTADCDQCKGKLFQNYDDCKAFMHGAGDYDSTIYHIWVDGWYDSQYSWESTGVNGLKLKDVWEDDW